MLLHRLLLGILSSWVWIGLPELYLSISITGRTTMNMVVGFFIFGLLVYGVIRIAKVKNVAEQITTTLIKPRVHKVSLSGMTFRSEVKFESVSFIHG